MSSSQNEPIEDTVPVSNRFQFRNRYVYHQSKEVILELHHSVNDERVFFKLNLHTNLWLISKDNRKTWTTAFKNALIVKDYDQHFTDKYQINIIYINDPYIIDFISFCVKNQEKTFMSDIYSKYIFYREIAYDIEKL